VARRIERPERSTEDSSPDGALSTDGSLPSPRPRRLVLLARPGAGKSTQSRLLATRLGLHHIDTGARLRREVASGSAIGKAIGSVLELGLLASDELVFDLVRPALVEADDRGYLLDGFPRNLSQAHALAALVPVVSRPQMAVLLEVDPGECRRRLLARAALEHRVDDTSATITTRLDEYERETVPVISWFEGLGALIRVDGSGRPEEVTEQIVRQLERIGGAGPLSAQSFDEARVVHGRNGGSIPVPSAGDIRVHG